MVPTASRRSAPEEVHGDAVRVLPERRHQQTPVGREVMHRISPGWCPTRRPADVTINIVTREHVVPQCSKRSQQLSGRDCGCVGVQHEQLRQPALDELLDGIVDVYMPAIKLFGSGHAHRYPPRVPRRHGRGPQSRTLAVGATPATTRSPPSTLSEASVIDRVTV